MFNQKYNIYSENQEELKFWTSKKLEDIKKDILDMVSYYGEKNIKNINIELNICTKNEIKADIEEIKENIKNG